VVWSKRHAFVIDRKVRRFVPAATMWIKTGAEVPVRAALSVATARRR
jgi:hypothetical protein